MKRVLFLLLFCFLGVASAIVLQKVIYQKTYSAALMQPQNVLPPKILLIPSIHVHAAIESVGLDNMGLMDIPKIASDTAWYSLGPKPGEIGNAVIDGHVDTQTGAPAVFALLKNLKKGDTIEILDKADKSYFFRVAMVENLSTNNFPVQQVFGATQGAHLNLITCSGVWDKKLRSYNQRLVVFSDLVGEPEK